MDKCMEKLLSLTLNDPQTETRMVTRLGLDVTVRELPYDEVERCGRQGIVDRPSARTRGGMVIWAKRQASRCAQRTT